MSTTVKWILTGVGIFISLWIISGIILLILYLRSKRKDKEEREGTYASNKLNKMTKVKFDNFIVQEGDIEAQVIKVDLQERIKEIKNKKKNPFSANKVGIFHSGEKREPLNDRIDYKNGDRSDDVEKDGDDKNLKIKKKDDFFHIEKISEKKDKEENNDNENEEAELQKKLDNMSYLNDPNNEEESEDLRISELKFISNNSVNRRLMELEKKEVSLIKILLF